MVAAARRDRGGDTATDQAATSYVVDVPGGRLTVAERADGHVELTGPAVLVARGELTDGWLDANRGATPVPAVSPLT
jgi:diaminopimelate epimerase